MDRFLNIQQLSEILSVKPMTIYGWIHDGIIPYLKLGRLVRFSEREIQEWLNKKRREGRVKKVVEMELN
ncbi:MAG: helix-turn-helix domain-containing protein [Candidatus Edwardsbacteria bacterium]